MNPITVISAISAIASLLSIVFDVPNKQKVSVSFKTFLLILSVVFFLFILIFSPYFKSSSFQPKNEPTSSSTVEPISASTDDPASTGESTGVFADARFLQVDPIVPCLYTVNPIIPQPLELPTIEIEKNLEKSMKQIKLSIMNLYQKLAEHIDLSFLMFLMVLIFA